jgi:hypothetical protein
MKISELIEQLNQLKTEQGDRDVVLKVTDHTDWTYNLDFPGFQMIKEPLEFPGLLIHHNLKALVFDFR